MRDFVFKLSSRCIRQERVRTYFRKVFVAGRLKLARLFLKRLCRTTRTWQEALQWGMWHRKRLDGIWQWCHLAAAGKGPEMLRDGALELVQGTRYLWAARAEQGERQRCGQDPPPAPQIRECRARTHNCYSCTLCESLFSKESASSSCHPPSCCCSRNSCLLSFLPSTHGSAALVLHSLRLVG